MDKSKRKNWILLGGGITIFAALATILFLARGLLLPIFTAFVLSYVFKPLVYTARLKGIPRSVAVTTIVVGLLVSLGVGFRLIEKALPKGANKLEQQVRIQYQLNQNAHSLFGTADANSEGSFVYKYLHNEIDTMMKAINAILNMTPADNENFQIILKSRTDENSKKTLEMLEANNQPHRWSTTEGDDIKLGSQMPHFSLSQLMTWFLMPIVFFFLLIDDGSLLRFFLGFIPNAYFELALTVLERVDKALGHYLRGTALECAAVGAVVSIVLIIFGVDLTGSVAIGFIAGILNAIPFLGMLVALVSGIVYVIMLDTATPLLPFLTKDHLIIGVCVAIGFSHLLDNALFQPFLVGRAVNLHPLGIIITVAASGMAFGMLGIVLAVPVVVTVKVCVETIYTGLRDYRLM